MTDKQYLKYIWENELYDFTNKSKYLWDHIAYKLNQLCSMISLEGIDDVPGMKGHERELKLQILTKGFSGLNVHPIDGNYYGFNGGLGGEPDAWYEPTLFTYSNPYLNISGQWKIHDDVVIVRNDSNYQGVLPILTRHGTLQCETELSMMLALYNERDTSAWVACDDKVAEAVDKYIDDKVKGHIRSIVGNKFLSMDGGDIRLMDLSDISAKPLAELIEFMQYDKASEDNAIGLNANYNMKREALNSSESALNDDILFPWVDDMINNWTAGFDEWNEKNEGGYEIHPVLKSSWEDNKKEEEAEIEEISDDGEDKENTEEEEKTEDEKEEKEDKEDEQGKIQDAE